MGYRLRKLVLLLCFLSVGCSSVERQLNTVVPNAIPGVAPFGTLEKSLPAPANTVGFDFLGIKSAHWNCDAMMSAVNTLPGTIVAGAFMDDTFGTNDACIKRLLSSGKVSAFRGHLAWTNHATVSAAALIPRAQYFDQLAEMFPAVKFYASPICEDSMNAQQSAALNAALRPHMPHIVGIVDSGTRAADPSAIREMHGPNGSAPFKSFDGQSAFDEDVEAFKRTGLYYALLWSFEDNCKFSDNDKRSERSRTDCPTQDEFNDQVRISFPQPAWPAGAQLAPNEIWKPFSENYGGCKGRDCKPVAILNRRFASIRILAVNGATITTCPYGGVFGVGQSRYYCPMSAFQIGQRAETVAQSEFVFVDAPGYRVVINAYRRGGKVH